jgi:outer membrane protein TolC
MAATSAGRLHLVAGLLGAIAIAACSPVPYAPRPLDSDAAAREFLARSTQADGLRMFAEVNGYARDTWPPAQWGLKDLTLVALYFHPDIRVARARAVVAHAELGSAAAPRAWSARLQPGYHSRKQPEDKGPWSLGLELEIPLVSQDRRAARVERSAFLADAADLDIASTAWSVRSRVRDRYLDLQAGREALASLDAQLAARKEMLALVHRRVEAGMLSARDLGMERIALSRLELLRDEELARQQRARGELAAALGLPLDVAGRMQLRFEPAPPAGANAEPDALRRMALRNRLDVHRKLLEFGAADAEVKAAVAAQNPELTLGPGYTWDQGDNVWSLGLGLSLPPAAQARASIREARARRELAAEQFTAIQAEAIALAERAGAQYRLADELRVAAEHQLRLQQEQETRLNRQFDAGAADRMQRVAARLETLASAAAVQAAVGKVRLAWAQLEDAVQRPLLGDFDVLPDMQVSRSADRSESRSRATDRAPTP